MRIAVLASGNGTNFEALAKTFKKEVVLLLSNNKKAEALKRAKRLGVKSKVVLAEKFPSKLDYDKQIIALLEKEKIELVLLAGYMRIVTPYFVRKYKDRILNVHPSLLPLFPGLGAIKRVFKSTNSKTGVTVHVVDEGVDSGKAILQKTIQIKPDDSIQSLTKKIQSLEYKLYSEAVKVYWSYFSSNSS